MKVFPRKARYALMDYKHRRIVSAKHLRNIFFSCDEGYVMPLSI